MVLTSGIAFLFVKSLEPSVFLCPHWAGWNPRRHIPPTGLIDSAETAVFGIYHSRSCRDYCVHRTSSFSESSTPTIFWSSIGFSHWEQQRGKALQKGRDVPWKKHAFCKTSIHHSVNLARFRWCTPYSFEELVCSRKETGTLTWVTVSHCVPPNKG